MLPVFDVSSIKLDLRGKLNFLLMVWAMAVVAGLLPAAPFILELRFGPDPALDQSLPAFVGLAPFSVIGCATFSAVVWRGLGQVISVYSTQHRSRFVLDVMVPILVAATILSVVYAIQQAAAPRL